MINMFLLEIIFDMSFCKSCQTPNAKRTLVISFIRFFTVMILFYFISLLDYHIFLHYSTTTRCLVANWTPVVLLMTDKFGAAMTLVKSDIGTVRDYFFLSAYLLILVMLSACFFLYITLPMMGIWVLCRWYIVFSLSRLECDLAFFPRLILTLGFYL